MTSSESAYKRRLIQRPFGRFETSEEALNKASEIMKRLLENQNSPILNMELPGLSEDSPSPIDFLNLVKENDPKLWRKFVGGFKALKGGVDLDQMLDMPSNGRLK